MPKYSVQHILYLVWRAPRPAFHSVLALRPMLGVGYFILIYFFAQSLVTLSE